MKIVIAVLAATATAGLAACTYEVAGPAASPSSPSSPPAAASSAPASPSTPPATAATSSPPAAAPAATSGSDPAPSQEPASTQTAPTVSSPWAVVSAYYGEIESGDYQQAWDLISAGAVTGQTYQQFVNGFACTGAQQLSEVSQSGDQVTFDLDATNSCSGAVQHFTGTDTVLNGKIVAAHVVQTGG